MTDQNPPMMFDFYTRFYHAIASSKTNAEYCEKAYGRNLCQHGFADIDHIDQLIQIGVVSDKSKVLDLGCGNGMIAEYISDLTGAHLTGIDFIPQAIQDALERTKMKRERIDFHVMDFLHLNLPPASFDVIIAIDTLYFTNIQETLQGCIPCLKEDGSIIVFFDQSCGPGTPIDDYPKELTLPDNTELAQALQQLGYSYQYWDYSDEMLAHLRRRRPILEALKEDYEKEGNSFLYESHMGESLCIENAYTQGAGKRYLYLANKR